MIPRDPAQDGPGPEPNESPAADGAADSTTGAPPHDVDQPAIRVDPVTAMAADEPADSSVAEFAVEADAAHDTAEGSGAPGVEAATVGSPPPPEPPVESWLASSRGRCSPRTANVARLGRARQCPGVRRRSSTPGPHAPGASCHSRPRATRLPRRTRRTSSRLVLRARRRQWNRGPPPRVPAPAPRPGIRGRAAACRNRRRRCPLRLRPAIHRQDPAGRPGWIGGRVRARSRNRPRAPRAAVRRHSARGASSSPSARRRRWCRTSDLHRRADVDALVDQAFAIGRSQLPAGSHPPGAADGQPRREHRNRGHARCVRAHGPRCGDHRGGPEQRRRRNRRSDADRLHHDTGADRPERATPAPRPRTPSRNSRSCDAPAEIRIDLVATPLLPAVTDEAAAEARSQAERMAQDVMLADGKDRWVIPAETVHSWLSFEMLDGKPHPKVDVKAVLAAIKPLAAELRARSRRCHAVREEGRQELRHDTVGRRSGPQRVEDDDRRRQCGPGPCRKRRGCPAP